MCLFIFRPWLKIRVTNGLPNTTDRKLPLELLELVSIIVYHEFFTTLFSTKLLLNALNLWISLISRGFMSFFSLEEGTILPWLSKSTTCYMFLCDQYFHLINQSQSRVCFKNEVRSNKNISVNSSLWFAFSLLWKYIIFKDNLNLSESEFTVQILFSH